MLIPEINEKLIRMGGGLMTKIKFGFLFSYDSFDALKLLYQKDQLLQNKLHKAIYKK